MRLRIVKGYTAGVAERPFLGEEYGIEDVSEPTILIGEKLLKEGYEDIPGYQALAHELYHSSRSPRRRGVWPVVQSEGSSIAGLEDEIEAIMFASQSTGNPPSKVELGGLTDYANRIGVMEEERKGLVREAADRMGYEYSVEGW